MLGMLFKNTFIVINPALKWRENSNNQFLKLLLSGGEVALDIGSIAAAGEINPALKFKYVRHAF
jgi:hypothetical protein